MNFVTVPAVGMIVAMAVSAPSELLFPANEKYEDPPLP
jgi:hypothetical protein